MSGPPNPQATAEPSSTIAIALETVGDGETVVRDLRRVNDLMAPSALPGMAEMAGRPGMASHGSGTEHHTPRNRSPHGRVHPT